MRLVMTIIPRSLFRRLVVMAALLAVGAASAGVAHAHGGGDSHLPLADLSIDSEYTSVTGSSDDYWQIIVENNTVGNHPGFGFRSVQVEIITTYPSGATATTMRAISGLPSGGRKKIEFRNFRRNPDQVGGARVEARIVGTSPEESPGFQSNNVTELWFVNPALGPLVYTDGDTAVAVSISDRFPQAEGETTFTAAASRPYRINFGINRSNDHTQFDVQVKITLSPGLAFAGTPQAATSTTFDASTGIWDVGTLSLGTVSLSVPVTLSGVSLADLPLAERCMTAEVVRAVPWFASDPSKRENDTATACLGEYPKVLLTSGELNLFDFFPCVGVTAYPCTSADTLELVASAARGD